MTEELPSILVTDGWPTDANGALVEVAIPSTVDTYQAPRKITFLGETATWIPATTTELQALSCPNITTLSANICQNYTALKSVSFPKLKTLNSAGGSGADSMGVFRGCTSLTSVSMPELESINATGGGGGGAFYACKSLAVISLPNVISIVSPGGNYGNADGGLFAYCTALTSVYMPKLETIAQWNGGGRNNGLFFKCSSLTSLTLESLRTIDVQGNAAPFFSLNSLQTVNFPKLISTAANWQSAGVFSGCTGLTSVTLGSVGNPVTSLGERTFYNCTQAGLTITIYTNNGASLSGSKWGATNATIVYETA